MKQMLQLSYLQLNLALTHKEYRMADIAESLIDHYSEREPPN
jgi:hypothetical protein